MESGGTIFCVNLRVFSDFPPCGDIGELTFLGILSVLVVFAWVCTEKRWRVTLLLVFSCYLHGISPLDALSCKYFQFAR